MDEAKPKRNYKDSLFRAKFNNPEDLAAIHTHITSIPTTPDDININTLKHIFFNSSRNDLSYLVGNNYVVLCEGQSTVNQNMPLRMLVYVTLLYRRLLKLRDFFQRNRVPIPMPIFEEFYCGTEEQPPVATLRLSDSFPKGLPYEPPLELTVKRYNIGYNENPAKRSKLLECKPIHDYSFFVYDVQRRIDSGVLLETAIQNAIDYCISHDVMKGFLIEHEKEVLEMYSSSRIERAAREAAMEDGRVEGRVEGQTEERKVGIKALIASAKDFSASPSQAAEQLMKQYSLTKDEAQAAVQANW